MHSAIHHILAWKHVGGSDKTGLKNKCLVDNYNWVAPKCPFQYVQWLPEDNVASGNPSLSSFTTLHTWETHL